MHMCCVISVPAKTHHNIAAAGAVDQESRAWKKYCNAAVAIAAAAAARPRRDRGAAAPRWRHGCAAAAPRPRQNRADPPKKEIGAPTPEKKKNRPQITFFAVFTRFLRNHAKTDIKFKVYAENYVYRIIFNPARPISPN